MQEIDGLVAWYIGAARGNGNPYGVVIITVRVSRLCLIGYANSNP